eukprot:1472839-Pyramimonas_sp.AAC.2
MHGIVSRSDLKSIGCACVPQAFTSKASLRTFWGPGGWQHTVCASAAAAQTTGRLKSTPEE